MQAHLFKSPPKTPSEVAWAFHHGQMREICEKQEKYFKGKVIVFTAQSLILYQYPVNLLTYLKLY